MKNTVTRPNPSTPGDEQSRTADELSDLAALATHGTQPHEVSAAADPMVFVESSITADHTSTGGDRPVDASAPAGGDGSDPGRPSNPSRRPSSRPREGGRAPVVETASPYLEALSLARLAPPRQPSFLDVLAARDENVRSSRIISAVAAAAVALAGLVVVVASAPIWTAEASVMVLPAAGFDSSTQASLYETLSRGQVVETFAELVRNPDLIDRSVADLDDVVEDVDIASNPVPATSVILIRGSASTEEGAEAITTSVVAGAITYFDTLDQPYRIEQVYGADGRAESTGGGKVLRLLAVLAGAGATYFAARYASMVWLAHLSSRRRRHMLAEAAEAES